MLVNGTLAKDHANTAAHSFRDPDGVLFDYEGRILRIVHPSGVRTLDAFLETRTAREATHQGKLVRSARISAADAFDLAIDSDYVLEHERVPFPSYPYEWPPELLHSAGITTIDLALAALEEGFGLKDATPYNVLFRGSRPVFVDVLSFEQRDSLDAVWMAYGQFTRTFLLPLLAWKYFGLPLSSVFLGSRDGLEPEAVYRLTGCWQRLRPPFLGLVTLPKWLAGRTEAKNTAQGESLYRPNQQSSTERARFILSGLLRDCRRKLDMLAPQSVQSTWSDYLDHKSIYSPVQLAQKERFVCEAMDLAVPGTVLDVGANEGYFSFLAARRGVSVLAIDSDPAVTGVIASNAARGQLDVLPLVVDLARPTPAIGWRNRECTSFLDRASGKFDLVMMLAVVHHLLVTERIPLEQLLDLTFDLSRKYLLIEFVGPKDPMFLKIVRGREALYSHYTNSWFEKYAASRFELVKSERIEGLDRWLYLFRRRRART